MFDGCLRRHMLFEDIYLPLCHAIGGCSCCHLLLGLVKPYMPAAHATECCHTCHATLHILLATCHAMPCHMLTCCFSTLPAYPPPSSHAFSPCWQEGHGHAPSFFFLPSSFSSSLSPTFCLFSFVFIDAIITFSAGGDFSLFGFSSSVAGVFTPLLLFSFFCFSLL